MTTNATVGVSFSAGSVAKRILLFAINFFVLVLGLTCSILCLYQVKLMPESYDVILAAMAEANMTAAVNSPSSVTSSSPQRLNRSTDNMSAIELSNAIEDNSEIGSKSWQSEGQMQMIVEQFRKKLRENSSSNQSTSTIVISSSTQSPTRSTLKTKLTTESTNAFLPKDFTFTATSTSPSSLQTSFSLSSKSTLDSFSSFIGITSSTTTLAPPFFISKSTTKVMNGPSSFIPVTKDVVLFNDDATAVESLANNFSLLPPITFISSAPTASLVALTSTTSQFPNDSPTTTFSSKSTTTTSPIATSLSTTLKTASTTRKGSSLDLSGILDLVPGNKTIVRRRKRAIRTTIRPTTTPAPYFLTPETIPPYFEQIFFLVQTSLYVTLASGLLVFFASLLGICGGVFQVQGCLKFSVAAVVVVIMAEIATIGFIFVAHDKASNRNKNKNFDQNLQLLCDLANFCINPVMLVMVGAFLCVSVILQIASITLASKMIDSQNPSDPEKKWRKMMQSCGRTEMQLMASSGGGAGMFPFPGQMGYGNGGPYPSQMMMPNMNYFPQPFMAGHPGQRPVINIIS